MISNKDRSKWFGASDTHFICGNYETQTFLNWWLTKIGIIKNNFKNKYTETGSYYEHRIAKLVEQVTGKKLKLDRQIKLRKLMLRINLDAETENEVHEIKTTIKQFEKLPKNYWQQVQVQMFGIKKYNGYVQSYEVSQDYYENYFLDLEQSRLKEFLVEYDNQFIQKEYLPRLKYLIKCYKKKITPTNDGLKNYLQEIKEKE